MKRVIVTFESVPLKKLKAKTPQANFKWIACRVIGANQQWTGEQWLYEALFTEQGLTDAVAQVKDITVSYKGIDDIVAMALEVDERMIKFVNTYDNKEYSYQEFINLFPKANHNWGATTTE